VDSYVSKPFGHLAIRPSPPNTDLRYTKGYPTRTGWWVGCSPATRRAAPRTRRAPCCTRAGRAACWPRAAPHPALGELCAGEVRVLHSRRAGRPLATRVGRSHGRSATCTERDLSHWRGRRKAWRRWRRSCEEQASRSAVPRRLSMAPCGEECWGEKED
jgi:hypothetical protein